MRTVSADNVRRYGARDPVANPVSPSIIYARVVLSVCYSSRPVSLLLESSCKFVTLVVLDIHVCLLFVHICVTILTTATIFTSVSVFFMMVK